MEKRVPAGSVGELSVLLPEQTSLSSALAVMVKSVMLPESGDVSNMEARSVPRPWEMEVSRSDARMRRCSEFDW